MDVDNASQGNSDKKQYIKDCKDNIRLMLEYSALDGLSISCLEYPNYYGQLNPNASDVSTWTSKCMHYQYNTYDLT